MSFNVHEFTDRYYKNYAFLYNARGYVAGYNEAVAEFDTMCRNNRSFQKFVAEFVKFRGDFISSDREAAAFMFTVSDMA